MKRDVKEKEKCHLFQYLQGPSLLDHKSHPLLAMNLCYYGMSVVLRFFLTLKLLF